MHLDPILPALVLAAFLILVLSLILRRLRQPALIGYLLAGLLLGPSVLGLFTDVKALTRLGEIGVILLLLFVGMEISWNSPGLVDSYTRATNWAIAHQTGTRYADKTRLYGRIQTGGRAPRAGSSTQCTSGR